MRCHVVGSANLFPVAGLVSSTPLGYAGLARLSWSSSMKWRQFRPRKEKTRSLSAAPPNSSITPSLVPQRHYWIDSHRPPCRQIRGRSRNQDKQQGHTRKCCCVAG